MKFRTPIEKRAEVLSHLMHGTGIRRTAEVVGVHTNTLYRIVGVQAAGARVITNELIRNVNVSSVEMDEATKFVRSRQDWRPWIFGAIATDEKLLISLQVGARNGETANSFVRDVCRRVVGVPAIATDQWAPYANVIERWFGAGVQHNFVVKEYDGRRVSDITYMDRSGNKVTGHSTSIIERLWLTVREAVAYMQRRTLRHAKSLEHFKDRLAIFHAWFNMARPHQSLGGATPAGALGLLDGVAPPRPTLVDFTRLLENYAERSPTPLADPEPQREAPRVVVPDPNFYQPLIQWFGSENEGAYLAYIRGLVQRIRWAADFEGFVPAGPNRYFVEGPCPARCGGTFQILFELDALGGRAVLRQVFLDGAVWAREEKG